MVLRQLRKPERQPDGRNMPSRRVPQVLPPKPAGSAIIISNDAQLKTAHDVQQCSAKTSTIKEASPSKK